MRTTLKRGIGRSAAANGNGRAILPPVVPTPVAHYRQPPRPRRGFWGVVGRVFVWLFVLASLVGIGAAGGAYLYYNESVAAVAAHSKDVREASKHLAIPLPGRPAI